MFYSGKKYLNIHEKIFLESPESHDFNKMVLETTVNRYPSAESDQGRKLYSTNFVKISKALALC